MIFKNSNKAPEIAQICDKIQRDYVPSDQKRRATTEERARNASWANVLADNEIVNLHRSTRTNEYASMQMFLIKS
jgi:hypothetical protein